MRTTVKTTDDAPTDLAQRIEAADESLRISFSGMPLDEVVPEVRRSLDELDLDLSDETVRDWAQHVSDRADYVLEIH
ncbi:hypothetical protein [Aeromicrobium chenweiae]|uniref:hypothetical protein n=1 Tax=Aeromicrobium chenweiae TaxID=2079793 RepID=UPI0010918BDF|nr:hypothetical protein [Aeromicrobium chenweiae]TGN33591.1 hypothetical protein E4L97_00605 [Aeromicrobium chenweiae]